MRRAPGGKVRIMATGTAPLLVASNRGPLSFTERDDGTLEASRGGGGLVSGLSSLTSSDEFPNGTG